MAATIIMGKTPRQMLMESARAEVIDTIVRRVALTWSKPIEEIYTDVAKGIDGTYTFAWWVRVYWRDYWERELDAFRKINLGTRIEYVK